MKEIDDFIKRLQAIAKKNGDQFRYRIDIEPRGSGHPLTRNGPLFTFLVSERADGHTFLSGSGPTIGIAVTDAENSVAAACKEWGYKE